MKLALKKFAAHFLALERIKFLSRSYAEAHTSLPVFSWIVIIIAILLGLAPLAYLQLLDIQVNSILVLACTAISVFLALYFRQVSKEEPFHWKEFLKNLNLTHTAFALGCIPLVGLILIQPDFFIQAKSGNLTSSEGGTPSLLKVAFYIVGTSFWAGITEEVLYRGFLLHSLRRLPLKLQQKEKDSIAVLLSALIFAMAHIPAWGVTTSIGLVGLGIGLGVAYISTRERLGTLILYHTLFDMLSACASIFLTLH